MKKTFVGFDLGDGETITDQVTLEINRNDVKEQHSFPGMIMPDQNIPGIALPTAFAKNNSNKLVFSSTILAMPDMCHDITVNFKRRPTDLMGVLSDTRHGELMNIFEDCNSWPSSNECPECLNKEFDSFKSSVIEFTNGIFENPQFKEKLRSEAVDSESFVFCVGHPTKWDSLDVAIYKAILKESVLGMRSYADKPSELVMAAESRAAFLYCKDKTEAAVLQKGTCALLVDIGSSTVDLTALAADSRNHCHNSGNNYLGARGIDLIIRDWYLDELSKDADEWQNFQEILTYNPTVDKALTLACRKAKEKIYSTEAGVARIECEGLKGIRLTIDKLDELINTKPLAKVLKNYVNIPDDVVLSMGNKTWKQVFESYLSDELVSMKNKGLNISRIILTGSASRMPFVPPIIQKVFKGITKENILNDTDPSRTISKGLALVGPSNEKSQKFTDDLKVMLDGKIPKIVEDKLPSLATSLSNIIEDMVVDIMKARIREWRNGHIKTIDEMTRKIEQDCSESNLKRKISNNAKYNKAIKDWITDDVSKNIAVELKALCSKYGVNEFSVDDLNIMKIPNINVPGVNIDPTDFAKVIVSIVSVIAGIVGAIVLPFVLGVVIGIISWISVGLAAGLLSILLAIPGPGWAILMGVAGYAVIKAASRGLEGTRNELSAKLQKVNLPQWVRNRMSDDKINQKINEANISGKIRTAILEEKSKKSIVDAVVTNLKEQVKKRAEDIKYTLEAK